MNNNFVKGNININAAASKIWDTLTNPEKIMLYLGSQTITDWKESSLIVWNGEMHGIKYQNKGEVLEHQPEKLLRFSYWSGMGGDEDTPENYSEITYRLTPLQKNMFEFTYARTKLPTAMEQQLFEQFLPAMLMEIKKISEEE